MVEGELKQRIITAAVIIPVCLLALFTSETTWTLLVVVIAMLMAIEWQTLCLTLPALIRSAGIPYMAIALASAILLRTEPYGVEYIIFAVACVIATDTAAYFGGKRFGRRKLAPTISPSKTVEGLGCGVAAAVITGIVATTLEGYPFNIFTGAFLGGMLALAGQAGDVLESAIKRRAGVKDSGTLLPGHGGLLDRMDGYMLSLPLFYAFLWIDYFTGAQSSAAL